MRQLFFIIILITSNVKAQSFSKTKESIESISNACLSLKPENMRFCDDYQAITKNVSQFGKFISDKVIQSIPYPEVAIFSGFLIKALVDQKVVIDPKIKAWGKPKIEIKPQETIISLSYDI